MFTFKEALASVVFGLLVTFITVLLSLLMGMVVMLGWNWVADLLGARKLTLLPATGIVLLGNVIHGALKPSK